MEKKVKITAWASILFFILLLIPVLYLSYVNRATGDDYNYSIYTRAAWLESHSLIAVIQAAFQTAKNIYYSWQGTWFSVFVFSLQPEVFHDDAYFIVSFFMLFLWIGSTFYLFGQILCRNLRLNKWNYILITICFLVIGIEFIPSYKSSIFWFNGCAHYMLPFSMCQIVAAWLLRYIEAYKTRYLIGIIFFMTLLGGSNYLAALFPLIIAFYVGIAVWFLEKKKRILTLLIPIFTEMVGLIISMKSPGNQVRVDHYGYTPGEEIALAYSAGDQFGFSAMRGIQTIGYSFLYAVMDIGKYLKERPIIFIGLFFLFLLFLVTFCVMENPFHFRHPILLCGMLFCLDSAMQAPAIYSGVPVSGGVPNMNFQVFILTASGMLLVLAERIAGRLKERWRDTVETKALRFIVLPGILLCFILAYFCRHDIKISTTYVSWRYIASGEAADFKEQMDLQTRLMEEEGVEDVVVPFINDVQGPLMHMPVTSESDKFTNWATAQFYDKNSVIAIDRPLWMELYGEEQAK
ncbi:MAG: hypothetical protein K2H40_15645 [Lachnospiraceae bacterium]|nr:hypothetical protein [Lachnospiraceae bacterium]